MMPSASDPAIMCRDVRRNLALRGRATPVLAGVDLTVPRGSVTVVTGKSGAGKTTLISILGGLDRPDSGSVVVLGTALERESAQALARKRRSGIGMIFQSFNLMEAWTALENVEVGLWRMGSNVSEARRRASDLLDDLGLGKRRNHFPRELSMGEQQRVAVARTLAAAPDVVLADEPTGCVDTETGARIAELLVSFAREHGRTVVVATHGAFDLGRGDLVYRLESGVMQRLS
jgi:putative ABC transport system ATP-binding protein